MLEQQGEELGGAGEPPERECAELVGAGVGVTGRDDLADAVHDRVDGDRVAGFESGDEGAQSVLIGPAEPEVAPSALCLAPLVVQLGVGLDDLRFGDGEDASGCFGRDHPGDRGVHDVDRVGVQVAGEPGDAPSHPHLALTAAGHGPGQREPVLEVEDVGEHVAGGGDAGTAGQRDLAETEVLHPWRALPTHLPQHVADTSRDMAVGALGRVGGVDRRPCREQLEPMHLGEPGRSLGLGRGGQEAFRVEVDEVGVHASNASRDH